MNIRIFDARQLGSDDDRNAVELELAEYQLHSDDTESAGAPNTDQLPRTAIANIWELSVLADHGLRIVGPMQEDGLAGYDKFRQVPSCPVSRA